MWILNLLIHFSIQFFIKKVKLKSLKFIKFFVIVFVFLAFSSEAEFKEFEPRLKYGSFHLKLFSIFQDLAGAQIKQAFGVFETRLKFIKFGLWSLWIFIQACRILIIL